VPTALRGLKDFDWLLLVRYSRRILFLAYSIDTHCYCLGHVQFGVALKFELLDSIHQDLRSQIILRYHCNVIHEGYMIELICLFNTMTDD
jgi:hypothetical protein